MTIKKDELIDLLTERSTIFEYAQKHFEQLKADADKAEKIRYGSKCDIPGIICPSLIKFRRDKKLRKGRFINEIPEGKSYTVYQFNSDDVPKRLRAYNQFGCDMSVYFFDFKGYQYAVPFFRDTDMDYKTRIYKYLFKDGRIMEYYEIERCHVIGEKYDYNHFDEGYIDCYWFSYLDSSFSSISTNLIESTNRKLHNMGISRRVEINSNIVHQSNYFYRIFLKDEKIINIKEYKLIDDKVNYVRNV